MTQSAKVGLVWRENVVRFFAPFDHKDPVWSYLVAILELTAPYALFLPMVVLHNARDKRYRRPGVADVLIFFGGIYLFFSLSGSRRPYYLLPILPFGAILLGGFLVDFAKGDMRDGLRRWTRGVLLGVGGLLVVASIAGPIAMCRIPVEWRGLLGWRLLPVALACALSGGLMAWRGECLRVERVVMSFLVIGVAYGLFLIPCIAKDRPIREDVAALTALAKPVAFIGKGKADIMFYLDSPHLVLPDLQAAIDWALDADGILILGRRQAPISGFATIVKCRTWSAQHPLADVDAPDRLVQTATVPCE